MNTLQSPPAAESKLDLSIAVIGPSQERRNAMARALTGQFHGVTREVPFYPDSDRIQEILTLGYDVLMIEFDSNPELTLKFIENVSARSTVTVMVWSEYSDSDALIRCMRAGAREFFVSPPPQAHVMEALTRASTRRSASVVVAEKPDGRLCIFTSAKGGSGATTIATNFAIAAAAESGGNVLLIDLVLPLGDAILNFGLTAEHSTVDALGNHARLDGQLLSRLVVQHDSGVSILPAPGKLVPVSFSQEAIDKLIRVARQEFGCVVVDAGTRVDMLGTALFDSRAQIYLVSQVSVAELRNSNRLVSEFAQSGGSSHLEIVLNRHSSQSLPVGEEQIVRALTRIPQWRIPNDFNAVRNMQATATPIASGDSAIARAIRRMARAGLELPPETEPKKKLFGIF